ncbi:phenazine biosynthesis protein PhzF family [Trichodesmium erythraeum IMS101]|uniref:Phenazine biosynthesis protein PhzF family n=1 Tax=Trichodesmium erythraeum (strain IMS101) TaxID=203124 RepID=Q116Y0_TRIEI|nr:PhzF family phenazine biosynthesis protein [Trichodesmium erythraeum GBRTRLIN201]MCH2048687.1 PhzF family phenazine biosynthesis protein [Trichodesmium sp. ALOHA_ZT_67]MDE5092691.1 PhzF family phenazine biosynthesis protein [Trichodesmium sp. St11_bin5]MDT9339147.1 PhzF family phenazine biosynthesis protein [Trichodesmium erythraeum 21-75]
MDFYIVDVFAETKYSGNQLAVFTGAEVANLSDEKMLQIAREMNYSETTFLLSSEQQNGGYDVRIFTPTKELPFAGHPTLGTAYIIQRKIIKSLVEQVVLNLGVGQIPVSWKGEVLWMSQNVPTFAQKHQVETVAEVLNLEVVDIDTRFPIQEVSTGIPFIIVPLKSLVALKKAKVNLDKYYQFIQTTKVTEILIFCPETYKDIDDLSVRMFAPYLGITEDPATGSANGCLAGYLAEYNYFNQRKIDIRVEQGYEINRPSLLLLQAEKKAGKIEVFVGGNVVMIAQGKFVA